MQPVPPGFCDSAIAEFIAKSSKLLNFRKSSLIFVIAADFGLSDRDIIAMHIQSKKGCFLFWKMEWTALRSHHARIRINNISGKSCEKHSNSAQNSVIATDINHKVSKKSC